MKSKIEELREELDLVKETLQAVECGISELDRAEDEPEFKEGDWVYDNNTPSYEYLVRWNNGSPTCGFFNGRWRDGLAFGSHRVTNIRKATPEEIEQALIKEAKRRGYEGEIHVKCLMSGRPERIKSGKMEYRAGLDQLLVENHEISVGTVLYMNGKWAKIVEPAITVNNYPAEFKDGYVQFGCAKIDNGLFDIYRDIEILNGRPKQGNRKIESVKIGAGEFTLEQLKQIAERL